MRVACTHNAQRTPVRLRHDNRPPQSRLPPDRNRQNHPYPQYHYTENNPHEISLDNLIIKNLQILYKIRKNNGSYEILKNIKLKCL